MDAMVRKKAKPIVREATLEDEGAVKSLQQDAGYTVEPRDNWPALWVDNPAWGEAAGKPSIGWVLEADGKIVGHLGNIPLLCRFAEKTLVAAAASGFAVHPAYRGYGLLLVAAFFKQKNVDLLVTTTASDATARIFQRFKALPLPQQDYNKILFWVLRPQPYVSSALRKMGLRPKLARFLSYPLANFLRVDISIRGRKPRRQKKGSLPQTDVRVIDVIEVGSEFDDLWSRKTREENRLLSYRTAETLRWHFAGKRARVLCCDQDGKLGGYAIVARDDLETLDLARSWIVDMFVEKDDPQIVDQLLETAYAVAMEDGSHVLEVMGFPQNIRSRFLKYAPYSRMSPNLPYVYLAPDGDLQKELLNECFWYACPYDGDASL